MEIHQLHCLCKHLDDTRFQAPKFSAFRGKQTSQTVYTLCVWGGVSYSSFGDGYDEQKFPEGRSIVGNDTKVSYCLRSADPVAGNPVCCNRSLEQKLFLDTP